MNVFPTTVSRCATGDETASPISLTQLAYSGGMSGPYFARVGLLIGRREDSRGWTSRIGLIDAIATAIRNMVPHEAMIMRYDVHKKDGEKGSESGAEVRIVLGNGRQVEGLGCDPDTVTASAKAYVHALNQLMRA